MPFLKSLAFSVFEVSFFLQANKKRFLLDMPREVDEGLGGEMEEEESREKKESRKSWVTRPNLDSSLRSFSFLVF